MSQATQKILASIDYPSVIQKRRENYHFLDSVLASLNLLKLPIKDAVPLAYPFLVEDEKMRAYLIKHKVYIPRYWSNIEYLYNKMNKTEKNLMNFLVPIPIDQRYSQQHMAYILKLCAR